MSLLSEFERTISKYLKPSVCLERDVSFRTALGRFSLSYVLHADGESVGLRCGGSRFDEWEDAMILGENSDIRSIYILSLHALEVRLEDALYLLSLVEPHIFTERGLINLLRLSSDDAKAHQQIRPSFLSIIYADERPCCPDGPDVLMLHRHSQRRATPDAGRPFWEGLYEYAKAQVLVNGPCDLERLEERWFEWTQNPRSGFHSRSRRF